MSSGTIDAHQSLIEGRGVESNVIACEVASVVVTACDKWGNVRLHYAERLFGIVVGGGAANGSAVILQETVSVILCRNSYDWKVQYVVGHRQLSWQRTL